MTRRGKGGRKLPLSVTKVQSLEVIVSKCKERIEGTSEGRENEKASLIFPSSEEDMTMNSNDVSSILQSSLNVVQEN